MSAENIINNHVFYEEEERVGCLVTRQTKKIWAVQLDLLNEFISICTKYKLRYFLCYGSLLGAIRHKGYIPWDDDIDVMMFREDYDKLCEVAPEAFKSPYFFQTEETDPGYLLKHAKVRNSNTTCLFGALDKYQCNFNQGIFIDVFVLDNIPDDYDVRIRWYSDLWQLWGRIWEISAYMHRRVKFSFFKEIKLLFLSKIGSYKKLCLKYDNLLKKYANTNTRDVADIVFTISAGSVSNKCTWRKSEFESFIQVPFEMLNVFVPKKYDSILNTTYGDWKELRPGGGSHSDLFFDTEKSYKEYIK